MGEIVSHNSGRAVLRPRARILRTFGDELISSETVAVIELVKNAYDADATRVLIRFTEPLETGHGAVEVIDNGQGMSLEVLQTAWTEPATLVKKRRPRSDRLGRRVLGEKGIGRFAASRLADHLQVITRPANSRRELRFYFDWSQFDDEEKYLDQVEVKWEELAPAQICPGGAIESLWVAEERPATDELTHGTILRMEGLRAVWGRSQVETLRTALSRLTSPFFRDYLAASGDQFRVSLEVPGQLAELSGTFEPPDMLRSPHYVIKGVVDSEGRYTLALRLNDGGEQSICRQYSFQDNHTPTCGPFKIELRVWDRDRDSMDELARQYSSTIEDVRRELDAVAGINVYRDEFRVLPYGEQRNDWLRLDFRRVQNPTLRLSNNQVVGFVLISADENPGLRDQSNREGLMEGQALNDLRELILAVLAELEQRRYGARPRKSTEDTAPQSRSQVGGLFTNFDLAEVRDLVNQRHPHDSELLSLVGEKQKDLERRVEEVQEVLGRYRRLATLGQLIDVVLHDGRAPLSKMRNEVHLALRDIERKGEKNGGLIGQLMERLRIVDTQAGVLATVFRKIEPFGGRRRGRPVEVRLEQAIADAFAVLDTSVAEVGVRTTLPDTETKLVGDPAEIQQVIINLLQNSLYWLGQVPQNQREIAVSVHRETSSVVEILFSDSGPGVEPEFRERIFDPYFSTKPDGVGLGLAIAGEIVSEYYGGSLELVRGGPLPGATFRITLRRRI